MVESRVRGASSLESRRRYTAFGLRECGLFLLQVALVVGVGSADDAFHALLGQGNDRLAVDNAEKIAHFEINHGLWIEPGLQYFFTHAHDFLGMVIGSAPIISLFDAIYGLGHVLVTLGFAFWMFMCRRPLFAFVRNVFLILNALAVITYELFPLAPPRLAGTFHYDGKAYHFIDTIFGGGAGVHLSFNELAAMPSLHVGWALIVALTLFAVLRHPVVRLLPLLWPVVMVTTVIVTGNHYLSDSLGAACLLGVAFLMAVLLEWRAAGAVPIRAVLRRLVLQRFQREPVPVARSAHQERRYYRHSAA